MLARSTDNQCKTTAQLLYCLTNFCTDPEKLLYCKSALYASYRAISTKVQKYFYLWGVWGIAIEKHAFKANRGLLIAIRGIHPNMLEPFCTFVL